LIGFTVRNGSTLMNYDNRGYGGGVYCDGADALITNCILLGNNAYDAGGGEYYGTVNDCVLVSNSAYNGAGSCNGRLNRCTVRNNIATNEGGNH